ncbi:hypothetical protein [Nocardia wallacei]|uniref:ESX-1 secretion-associated protein n=2 Tax=Nocardia wallacei TaxID=480035 RepID=A0A7G1L0V1_9NOCA|nr:hypothetical protein [Nocardia wallacei]BCK58994.1 hypothetical protein NWFMUON74_67660 [Nocardia wallacei]
MLRADVDQLNKLVTTLDDIAAQIDNINVRATGDQLGAALPGCALGAVCAQVGEFTEGAWLRVAERIRTLSGLVNMSTHVFSTTDEQFGQILDSMNFHGRGQH